jgi:hypothetical protein
MIVKPVTKAKAIKSLNSNAEFAVRGDVVEWINTTPIDEALITAEISRLQAEYDGLEYSRTRANEYPPIGDQLDALWKGGDDAAAMKVIVDKVKSDNPKG